MRLTQKQETFCLKYFELGNASEAARIANYSPKTAAVIGRENLLKPNIRARIDQLRQVAEDASVANVLERKQKLTEILRARMSDFMTAGPDGSWINIGPEQTQSAALQGVTSRTEVNDDEAADAVITKIKLHDPIRAIDILNRMDKVYAEGAPVVDNRSLTIIFQDMDEETKRRILQLASDEIQDNEHLQTQPESISDNGGQESAE